MFCGECIEKDLNRQSVLIFPRSKFAPKSANDESFPRWRLTVAWRGLRCETDVNLGGYRISQQALKLSSKDFKNNSCAYGS
jgi:hypothetical protein